MTPARAVALMFTLIGWLLIVAGGALLWGPAALSVGGLLLVVFGTFAIDVGGRDRK